ncbi:hypothetical protein SBRCBS47491_009320 [Sporothrix bragantina]|uniref:Transmembrane protein n=1 Tax=Sporothrix bragantina TaxID=671064 RepID=A0ABP0CVD8_9PEZI
MEWLGWHSAAHALVRVILTTTNESLLANAWDVLQATVFQHSTASAIPYFIVAVVLNHARRTLWFGIPIVGFFTRPQPDEDWRLLLARPDVFLEDLVKSVCSGYFVSLTQKRVWDILAGGLTGVFLLSDNDRPQSRIARTIHRRAKDITATLFLVWLASCIEYAVAQASTTLAIGMAVWKMTRSGQSELLFRIMFDGSFITTAWLLVFVWRQMVVYPWTGLVPMVIRSVSRPVPQPGVMLCLVFSVLTMDTLLRYRSRLYIAIETSGFFVFMGYAILSSMVLAADWRVKRDQRKQKNI